jgi:hypothetical protein
LTSTSRDFVLFEIGSIGGLVAGTITHPLSTVAMRLQAQTRTNLDDPQSYRGLFQALYIIARQEGRAGLYAFVIFLCVFTPNVCVCVKE